MVEHDIRPILELASPALDRLVEESEGEGFRFLLRLRAEYASGANRFDRPGELLLGAHHQGALVAIGGLNRDPYSGMSAAGRVRHLYVSPSFRRAGVGTALMVGLIHHAGRTAFRALVLRTDTAAGARFYESLGFEPTSRVRGATHQLLLRTGDGRFPG